MGESTCHYMCLYIHVCPFFTCTCLYHHAPSSSSVGNLQNFIVLNVSVLCDNVNVLFAWLYLVHVDVRLGNACTGTEGT